MPIKKEKKKEKRLQLYSIHEYTCIKHSERRVNQGEPVEAATHSSIISENIWKLVTNQLQFIRTANHRESFER